MANELERFMGTGNVKDGHAAALGLVGVFRTLAEQHEAVTVLLERARTGKSARSRRDLWADIRLQLLSHERAESSEIYRLLEQASETRTLARQHAREVQALEDLIFRLDGLAGETDGSAWSDLFEELIETVERHALEEEEVLFPNAQAAFGLAKAEELELPFLNEQKRVAAKVAGRDA